MVTLVIGDPRVVSGPSPEGVGPVDIVLHEASFVAAEGSGAGPACVMLFAFAGMKKAGKANAGFVIISHSISPVTATISSLLVIP